MHFHLTFDVFAHLGNSQVQRKLGFGVYTFPAGAAGALIRTSLMRICCANSHQRDAVGYHQTQCPFTTRLRVLKLASYVVEALLQRDYLPPAATSLYAQVPALLASLIWLATPSYMDAR